MQLHIFTSCTSLCVCVFVCVWWRHHGRASWRVWSRRTTWRRRCGLRTPWCRRWCGRESVSAPSPTPGKEATQQDTDGDLGVRLCCCCRRRRSQSGHVSSKTRGRSHDAKVSAPKTPAAFKAQETQPPLLLLRDEFYSNVENDSSTKTSFYSNSTLRHYLLFWNYFWVLK